MCHDAQPHRGCAFFYAKFLRFANLPWFARIIQLNDSSSIRTVTGKRTVNLLPFSEM